MHNILAKSIPPPPVQTLHIDFIEKGQLAWYEDGPNPHGLYIRTALGMTFLGNGVTYNTGHFRPLNSGERVELIAGREYYNAQSS